MAERDNDSPLSLEEVLERHGDALVDELHTVAPGRVESYDAGTQTCTVKPMIRRPLQRRDGSFVYEEMPVLQAVPVCHPRWGSWFIHAPLAAGDFVKLEFCERDIARWRVTGDISNPLDVRAHHMAHAVATPALYPRTRNIEDVSATEMVLGSDGGNTIRITAAGAIKIGTAAAHFVADGDLVHTELELIATTLASLAGAAFGTPYSAPGTVPSISATKVKVE